MNLLRVQRSDGRDGVSGTGSEGREIENFDDVAGVREPASYVRGVGVSWQSHFGVDELAIPGDRQGDPFGLRAVAALRDEIKAAGAQSFAEEPFGDVADGNDAAAAQEHAFDFRSAIGKMEDAAGRDEVGD